MKSQEPTDSDNINFSDRNAVERLLEQNKFRRCANLECSPVQLEHQVLYMPMCLEGRFKRDGFAEVIDMPRPPRPLSPVTYTTIPFWAPLVSCPADCKGYRNRTVARALDAVSSQLRRLLGKKKVAYSHISAPKKGWWEKGWGQAIMLTVTAVIAGLIVWSVTSHFEKHQSPTPAISNETTGDNSPIVQGNQGSVTLNNSQSNQTTKKPSNSNDKHDMAKGNK